MNAVTPHQPQSLEASLRSAFGITAQLSLVLGSAFVTGVTLQNQQAALQRIDAALAPAPIAQVDQWIAALHVGTKHRSEDPASLELIQKLYRATLSQFPASAARDACAELLKTSEWFPTIKELNEACGHHSRPLRSLRNSVASWREPEPARAREETETDRLIAEREAIRRKLGFVGDITKLSPEKRALYDRDAEIRERLREIGSRRAA